MSFEFGPKKYRFGQYWENDAENRRSKMSELTQFLRFAKQTVLFDFGPPCFCCCREFAALSRRSNWCSCEQRSLLYTLCLLLPPYLDVHCSRHDYMWPTHTDQKVLFMKIQENKNQTHRMHSSDPVFEASLQLVGDSNRKETSCEWEGPAINTGGCQLPKNYYLWIENQNLQGKCIRCLLKTDFDVVAEAYLKKSALPVPMYTSCICTSKAQEMRPNLEVGQRRLEP